MADLSGLGALQQRPKSSGSRAEVKWRARYFAADKIIHLATISAIFKDGFTISARQGAPVGESLNIEFVVNYRDKPTKIRFKGEVSYWLLRTGGDSVRLDVKITKISTDDLHIVNNLLQIMLNDPNANLRI